MQDVAEGGMGFSHKMGLNGGFRRLGIDHPHGRQRKAESGSGPGVSERQPRGVLPDENPAGGVRVGRENFAPEKL